MAAGVGHTFFHNVGGKLVLRVWAHVALYNVNDFGLIFWLPVFKDVLHNVVSILVFDQLLSLGMKFVQNPGSLLGGAVFENALDNATTIRMSREGVDLKTGKKMIN